MLLPWCATPTPTPIAPMSVCTKLGLNPSSRLAAYAEYVVLRGNVHAHECALAIVDPISSSHSPNECLCQFWAQSAQPFGRL
jgi:hypothetical protein